MHRLHINLFHINMKNRSIFNMTTPSLNDQGQSFPQSLPGFSKHQEGDRSHLCSYPPFKWSMSLTGVAFTLFLTYPHRKKSRGVRSGDLRGQAWGPSLPIHLLGKCWSRNCLTCRAQCGGAPSCWKKHFRIGISVQLGNTKCFQQVQIVILVDSFLF